MQYDRAKNRQNIDVEKSNSWQINNIHYTLLIAFACKITDATIRTDVSTTYPPNATHLSIGTYTELKLPGGPKK